MDNYFESIENMVNNTDPVLKVKNGSKTVTEDYTKMIKGIENILKETDGEIGLGADETSKNPLQFTSKPPEDNSIKSEEIPEVKEDFNLPQEKKEITNKKKSTKKPRNSELMKKVREILDYMGIEYSKGKTLMDISSLTGNDEDDITIRKLVADIVIAKKFGLLDSFLKTFNYE